MDLLKYARLPSVSIVILNLNRQGYLRDCLDQLSKIHYPRRKYEIIVVDNGSGDGSVRMLREEYPHVRIFQNAYNEGFAKPCNDGARAANGKYVVFLNNDVRVTAEWLSELVLTAQRSQAASACALILSADGSKVDFADGQINMIGHGLQVDYGLPIEQAKGRYAKDKEIFFGCGASLLIDREIFLSLGGFDEQYFAYFEDVDLGWRLRIAGERTMLSARSVCYHHHRNIESTQPKPRLQRLLERNALYTLYKNLSDEAFYPVLLSSLLVDFQRVLTASGIDKSRYDVRFAQDPNAQATEVVDSIAAAYLCALSDVAENLEYLNAARAQVQSTRKAQDCDVFALINNPFARIPLENHTSVRQAVIDAVTAFNVGKFIPARKRHVLIASMGENPDQLSRACALANLLHARFTVTLAAPNERPDALPDAIGYLPLGSEEQFGQAVSGQDTAIVQSPVFKRFSGFPQSFDGRYTWLMADLLDTSDATAAMQLQDWLLRCDAFASVSAPLREHWLTAMQDARRIDSAQAARGRIALAPWGRMGVTADPAEKKTQYNTVYYLGGNDVLCAVQALERARKQIDGIRLLVPSDAVDPVTLAQLRALCTNPDSRIRILPAGDPPQGDAALYCYKAGAHENTAGLAHCLAMGMPVISSDSMELSEFIARESAGIVYPAGDNVQLGAAFETMLGDNTAFNKYAQNALRTAPLLSEEQTLAPFMRFADIPRRLMDASDALFTDILQKRMEYTIGEILPDTPVCQRFICHRDGLCMIRLPVATYSRENACTLDIELYDLSLDASGARFSIDARVLGDNDWIDLELSPRACAGHRMELRISSADAVSGGAVTLWCAPSIDEYAGHLMQGGPQTGHSMQDAGESGYTLSYSTHYRAGPPAEQHEDLPQVNKKKRKKRTQEV